MKTDEISPKKLSFFRWNLVNYGDKLRRQIKNNLKEKGCVEPVKIRELPLGKEVWDGKERVKIAREIGIKKIPYLDYGKLSDNETKSLRASLAIQRGEDIDLETLYGEWYRLYEDEELTYKEISNLYGFSKTDIYQGISLYIENKDKEEDNLNETSNQITLKSWNNNGNKEEENIENTKTSKELGFDKKRKGLKGSKDNLIDKEPKELSIMISGKLHNYISKDVKKTGDTIPSKIVDILNEYYNL